MPEFTQFDNGKSIILYLPAKGTAGFARFAVSTPNREPSPPARMTARIFMIHLSLRGVRWHLLCEEDWLFHLLIFYTVRDTSLQNWARRNPATCLLFGDSSNENDLDTTATRGEGCH